MKLQMVNVTRKFGDFRAVENLNLTIENGVYGLLGVNGAGKTTLMRMICTLLPPTSGQILCDGKDIFKMDGEYRNLLGYLPQEFGFYPDFTVKDYLLYIASLKGIRPMVAGKRVKDLLAQVGLTKSANKKMKKLSGGMKRRAGIAQAMLNNPKILILDEPTAGLDPTERVRFRNLISELSEDRIVILSTHIVSDVEYIANEIWLMKDGQIMQQGNLDQTLASMQEKDELSDYLPEYKEMKVVMDFDLSDFVKGAKFISGWPSEAEYKTKPAKNAIRIEHLMSMTAGMSYQISNPAVLELLAQNPHAKTREIVARYATAPLLYEPGERYAYSLGHDVMAAVIEVVSGLQFSEYMKKNIFEPLECKDIYYHITDPQRMVCLYNGKNPETGELIPHTFNFARINDTYESGGGGILCSVDDYSKVIEALACKGIGANGAQILKPESIKAMSTNRLNPQQLEDFHIGGKHEYGYGLGVRTLMDTSASKSPLGEFGWDGAQGAYVLVDPQNELSVFYVQAAPDNGPAFATIHPTLRDLIYEAIQ